MLRTRQAAADCLLVTSIPWCRRRLKIAGHGGVTTSQSMHPSREAVKIAFDKLEKHNLGQKRLKSGQAYCTSYSKNAIDLNPLEPVAQWFCNWRNCAGEERAPF